MNKGIGLLGYSGHGIVVAESALLCGHKLVGYADKNELTINPFSLNYLGHESLDNFAGWEKCTGFILGIGSNKLRIMVADLVRQKGFTCLSIIHPTASVSSYTTIGDGTFVARNAAINPLCTIGKDVIINTSASIDHECIIGEGTHIAPGAVLAGNVTIGKNVFVGANAVIKQGVYIADNVIIGAGSVVLKNIASNNTVIGNPARILNG